MAKHDRKVRAALRVRQDNVPSGGKGGSQAYHMPGSLNRHKTGIASAPVSA